MLLFHVFYIIVVENTRKFRPTLRKLAIITLTKTFKKVAWQIASTLRIARDVYLYYD